MWIYEKKLQFPVDVKCKDLKFAKTLITQYGDPAGELTACLQYLNQRFTMPTGMTKALMTDIGTEEIAHLEIIGTMVSQIMQNASMCDLKDAGLDGYYSLHDHGLFYTDPNGYNWTADYVDGSVLMGAVFEEYMGKIFELAFSDLQKGVRREKYDN